MHATQKCFIRPRSNFEQSEQVSAARPFEVMDISTYYLPKDLWPLILYEAALKTFEKNEKQVSVYLRG